MPRLTESGKEVSFNEREGLISDNRGEVIAMAYRMVSLYYLGLEQMDNTANVTGDLTKKDIWHRRFGHLGERNLCKLAENSLVNGFDYDVSNSIEFCESCVSGKMCRSSFPKGDREREQENH